MAVYGVETRRRQLEEITAEELNLTPASGGAFLGRGDGG
jgi:hypothetical protein